MNKTPKSLKQLGESYLHQINVLKAMTIDVRTTQPRQLDISEIAELSGLSDEKEVLRYLYILEGHKLVAPYPPGSFTSKLWHITEDGVRAVKSISREMVN
jgi:hypothetical protein